MTDYTKTTDFAAKDSLPSGDSGKIIKGTEFETEFDNIATAIATKSNIASPTFTGTTTIPTVDINGGAIDGTVIGAASAAAITGTTITGTSFVTSGNMTFGDNDKAVFGAGSDLQIYHDGSNSYIKDAGTGNLYIQANQLRIQTDTGENFIECVPDGGVYLRYDNASKFNTTSTGIDVTGTVTADGLTIDTPTSGASATINLKDNQASAFVVQQGANEYINVTTTNTAEVITLGNTTTIADVIIPAGNVGIGTASPDNLLHLHGSPIIRMTTATTGETATDGLIFGSNLDGSSFLWTYENEHLYFGTNNTERVRITEAGNVGIGTTSPSAPLDIVSSATGGTTIELDNTSTGGRNFTLYSSGSGNSFGAGNFALYDADAAAVRLLVDSSGSVGIGTTSPSNLLDVSGAQGSGGISARVVNTNATSATTYAELKLETGLSTGAIREYSGSGSAGYMAFHNEGSERMRIDASGNLLVGTTDTNPTTGTSEGIVLGAGGIILASNTSDAAIALNRTTTDGKIAAFKKNGTEVGSIGVASSNLYFGTADAGIFANSTSDTIQPFNTTTGTVRDALIDLGSSGARFKDLYLSGGVVFGATGGAVTSKTLDDYEEGTFTPTLGGGTSFGTTTYTTQTGTYTKIGDTVHLRIYLDVSATTGSGFLKIGGIPFTVASLGSIGAFLPSGLDWGGGSYLQSYAAGGDAFLRIYYATDNANWAAQQVTNEVQQMIINISYQVA